MDGPLACCWLWLLPPLSLRRFRCFLSVCLLSFAAAAAGDGGRGPFNFCRGVWPASFCRPVGGCTVFGPSGGLLGTAVRRK